MAEENTPVEEAKETTDEAPKDQGHDAASSMPDQPEETEGGEEAPEETSTEDEGEQTDEEESDDEESSDDE